MKKIVFVGLLLLVAGCSGMSTRAVDQATLKNKTLSLIVHESPGFMAMTADKSMFNDSDVDAAYAEGNRLVQEKGITDPASKICKMMAEIFSTKYGFLYNSRSSVIKSKSKKMKDLVHLANVKDYLLDVETAYWFFLNKEYKRPDYYMSYTVKMKLIDVEKSRTVRKSTCEYDTIKAGKPPVSYRQLVENDAAYIKQSLNDATNFCINKFTDEFTSKD